MSVFNLRDRPVNYQYDAAENINFQTVENKEQLARALEKLKEELECARCASVVEQNTAIQAEFQIIQAKKEAKKDNPSKYQFLEHINGAKARLEGIPSVAGMITDLLKAAELANKFFDNG